MLAFFYLQVVAVEFLHSNPTAAPFHKEPSLPGNQMNDASDVSISKENWKCKALIRTSLFFSHQYSSAKTISKKSYFPSENVKKQERKIFLIILAVYEYIKLRKIQCVYQATPLLLHFHLLGLMGCNDKKLNIEALFFCFCQWSHSQFLHCLPSTRPKYPWQKHIYYTYKKQPIPGIFIFFFLPQFIG